MSPGYAILLLVVLGFGPIGAGLPSHSEMPAPQIHSAAVPLFTDARPLPPSALVRPLADSTPVTLTIVLAPRASQSLAAFDAAIIDPSSPRYHRFLTESQFERQFRPSSDEIAHVESYFARFDGRTVAETHDGFAVTIQTSAGGVHGALGVVPVRYSSVEGSGRTVLGVPQLPNALRSDVVGVDGLSAVSTTGSIVDLARSSYGRVALTASSEFVHDNQSGSSWYFGSDYAQAYRVDHLFPGAGSVANATFPTGEAIATILVSGYNQSTNTDLPPFNPAAIQQYYNDSFPAAWPKPSVSGSPVVLSSVAPPAPGPNGVYNDSSLYQTENSLDLEMAGSLAPGATLVNFYFGASLFESSSSYSGTFADAFAQSLSQALSYNYGSARLAAVTNSYGLPDLNDTLWDQELEHAAAIGVTVLAASGDQADAPQAQTGRGQGQWPGWPSTAAFATSGAVSVGGATVTVGGTPTGDYSGSILPTGYDSNLTGLSSSVAWYETVGANLSGTEGGVSSVYPEPSWQFVSAAQPAIANASARQGVTLLGRSAPDVAMAANNTIAYVDADASGIYFNILEGTSVASPLLAGELASLAAVAGHPFGFLDPELYRIGSYFEAFPSNATPFLDVTSGQNWVFAAAPGWDPVTGWGQVDAPNFLFADANSTVTGYAYTGPTPGIPTTRIPGGVAPSGLTLEYVAGAFIALLVAVVIVVASRPTQRVPPPGTPGGMYGPPAYAGYPTNPGPPPGASYGTPVPVSPYPSPPPPPPVPAWFACPYCGAPRPAEPVRCPYCGRL